MYIQFVFNYRKHSYMDVECDKVLQKIQSYFFFNFLKSHKTLGSSNSIATIFMQLTCLPRVAVKARKNFPL